MLNLIVLDKCIERYCWKLKYNLIHVFINYCFLFATLLVTSFIGKI